MRWKLSWGFSFLLFGFSDGHIFFNFSNYCPILFIKEWTLLVRAQLGCARRVLIHTTLRIMHFALARSYAVCTGWLLCMHRSAFLLAPGDTKSLPDACDQYIAARKLRERDGEGFCGLFYWWAIWLCESFSVSLCSRGHAEAGKPSQLWMNRVQVSPPQSTPRLS